MEEVLCVLWCCFEEEEEGERVRLGCATLLLIDVAESIRPPRHDLSKCALSPFSMSPWRALLTSRSDRGFMKTMALDCPTFFFLCRILQKHEA